VRQDGPVPIPPQLAELARAHGVAVDYWDWKGREVEVSAESITAVLAALGVDTTDPEAALRECEERPWRRTLPSSVVATAGVRRWFAAHVPHGDSITVDIDLENGGVLRAPQVDHWVDPRHIGDRLVGEATFVVPEDVPLGYHTLRATTPGGEATAPLIVTPGFLGLPERLRDRHAWGLAAQLYSVRSHQSWAVGDLVDLADLAVWSAAELGADFLLVNPLHAAEPTAPMEPSPYLPASRQFFNPLYVRVERIPEYADLSPRDRATVEGLATGVHLDLDDADVIDRDTSWTAKRAALELVHAVPRTVGRDIELRAFCARHGDDLRDFATWRVLALEHGTDYRSWPAELQDVHSPAVAEAREQHADAVHFEMWLQWVLDEQLQSAQAKAVQAGMALGTMHDLAVGVHPGGADAWRLRTSYATGIQVGAPPDPFNQVGQNWSQPPWRPDRLEELGYAPLRSMIGAVLRHAGGVRVDHVIGLFRLWWVPEGMAPSEGTYVRYDHEAMIGVLALEAHRAGAVVVGEDLGVVEPSARAYLEAHGLLGTSILWFERDGEGRPLGAEHWRELCLASVTTHDLPPSAGYLAGEHVQLRERLGLLTRPLEEELAADEAERESWLDEVRARGLLAADVPVKDTVEETVRALHAYLALTPARLGCVSLTDAVGDHRTQNQPGTTDEYPNWRVPLSGPDGVPILLEDVIASSRVADLVQVVRD
jgi:4-alpha-glucanotransferase